MSRAYIRSVDSLERAAAEGDFCARQLLAQIKSPRAAETAGDTTAKEMALPAEPTIEELVEARERTDAGMRLAFPHLFDRLMPPAAPEPLNAEAAARVGAQLLDAQAAILTAAAQVPLEGEELLHSSFNQLINQLDGIGRALAERFGS